MRRFQTVLSPVCVMLLLLPMATPMSAQTPAGGQGYSAVELRMNPKWWDFKHNYKPVIVPENDYSDSPRLEQLIKGGNIYLSLRDAIALALENNVDVENQRLGASIARASVLLARAGGAVRGTTPAVASSPTSATTGSTTSSTSTTTTTTGTTTSSTGTVVQQTGSSIPSYDPTISLTSNFSHTTTLSANSVVAGNLASVVGSKNGTFNVSQGFSTGTNVTFGYTDLIRSSNSYTDIYNPARTASLTFRITQNLLQGFGRSVNNRNIEIARNNVEGADQTFKQQVITTVTGIQNLYWDLVAFNDDVKAKKQALETNQNLYNNNKRQVEVGTLAPIAIVQAEAAVASSEQDLILSQTRVLQQETIIKNYLTHGTPTSTEMLSAHVIPTDHIEVPKADSVLPMQDLFAQALQSRPELASSRITVTNSKINLRGSKNQLLPTLQLTAGLNDNGLTGVNNDLPIPPGAVFNRRAGDSFFTGGYATLLGQLFARNFPDYSAGITLSLPLRNRSAQAGYVLDQLTLRQNEIALHKLEAQIRVEVQNALIGLQQSRAVLVSAQKAKRLQELTLDAEQKKLTLGVSTIYNVILVQRDLATAQSAEVTALANYVKAKVELDRATGNTLANNNVSVQEAFQGRISTPPAAGPQK